MKLSCTGSLTGPTALPRLAPDPTIPTRGNHLAPTVRSVLERPGRASYGRPRRGQTEMKAFLILTPAHIRYAI